MGTGQAGAGRTALTATGSALFGKLGRASNYGSGVLRTGLGKNTGRMYLAGALRRVYNPHSEPGQGY